MPPCCVVVALVFSTVEPSGGAAFFTNQPLCLPSQMIPPNARSKTTIGTATATARVVVETPLLDFPALEVAEVFGDVPVEVPEDWPPDVPVFAGLLVDAAVEVPELCALPPLSLWLVDVPVTTDCQNTHSRIVTATRPTGITLRPSSRITLRALHSSRQPAIIRTNDSEVIRVHHIRPGFQLNRVITA